MADMVRGAVSNLWGTRRRADREALKRRSFDALGRFRSGATDLASGHDRRLEDAFGA